MNTGCYFAIATLLVTSSTGQIFRVSPVVLNEGECPANDTRTPLKQALQNDINTILSRISLENPPCPCRRAGHWTKVANLTMNDTSQQCPPNWDLVMFPIRGCGRSSDAAGTCDSAFFQTFGRSYRQVCGRVIGYQRGSPNAFNASVTGNVGLEGQYIDGFSLTYGPPGHRQHIWSFASAHYEDDFRSRYRPESTCACTRAAESWPYILPSFIGNNYFCDTASRFGDPGTGVLTDDPLWDGAGCGPTSTCCEFNHPPWFCTTLPQPTTNNLELRVCHDQTFDNEDVIVNVVEMYIS